MRPLVALASSVLLAGVLTACSSNDTTDDDRATGALEGKEDGYAKGSTTEVDLDPSVVAAGLQDSQGTPASVLGTGPATDTFEAVELVFDFEILDLVEISVDDFNFDSEDLATVEGTYPYVVHYRADYLNGPLIANGVNVSLIYRDADGEDLSAGITTFGGSNEHVPTQCDGIYSVESFGEGASNEGCVTVFLTSPEIDSIAWNYYGEGESAPADPIAWPID